MRMPNEMAQPAYFGNNVVFFTDFAVLALSNNRMLLSDAAF